VLDDAGEEQRRQSLAERRRHSLARKRSHADDGKSRHDHDIEKGPGTGADQLEAKDGDESGTTSEEEPNIVWWDGPDDPQNSYNWPTWRKVLNCTLISTLTFVTSLTSSIFAPGCAAADARVSVRQRRTRGVSLSRSTFWVSLLVPWSSPL
jgi:hypothetical protein